MPIPFHDAEEIAELGSAAFLHIEQPTPASVEHPPRSKDGSSWAGAVRTSGSEASMHAGPAPGRFDPAERFAALLFINARGEPLEFVYNRLELISDVLWRPADRARAAVRRLAATLFDAATLTPTLMLCRADAVDPHLFGPAGQLALDLPVGRVATAAEAIGYTGAEQQETLATADSAGQLQETHVFWTPGRPEGAAAELFARLMQRGLLLEPFERAGRGLREVYGDPLGTRP